MSSAVFIAIGTQLSSMLSVEVCDAIAGEILAENQLESYCRDRIADFFWKSAAMKTI